MFNVLCNSKTNRVLRGGGAGYEEKAVLLDVVCNGVFFDNPGWANADGSAVPLTPEVGKEYVITITDLHRGESMTFTSVAYDLDGIAVIGNSTLLNGPKDTSEPFVCAILGTQFIFIVDSNYQPSNLHVKISTETIHPIDPKYLPGVCLPVVEIAPGGTAQPFEVDLSAEQVAVVREAGKNCVPIIVAFRLLGGEVVGSAVVSLTNALGNDVYLGSATVGINGAFVWQVEVETGAEGEGAAVYITIPEST